MFPFQAEHGPDSQVVLVLAGEGVDITAIEDEIEKQCNSLPRGAFASKALSHSFTVHARDMVEVCIFPKFRLTQQRWYPMFLMKGKKCLGLITNLSFLGIISPLLKIMS